jgi:UDP-N-acetylmuramoyl-L-alanyl-D-glutamate--2,6-diaminopimelate ligase
MKLLKDILYKAGLIEVHGSTQLAITSIAFDSRKVERNTLFIAVNGTQSNGHDFIDQAIEKGAIAIACETLPKKLNEQITYVVLKDTAFALGLIATNFYGNPSTQLALCGVTGTNGKTTVATLLFRLFSQLGFRCGLISTVQNQIGEKIIPSSHTTPDAIALNQLLSNMVNEGCTHVFMEVSSHALAQHRVAGLQFKIALFTNITHDHLDYHKTFENYFEAKKLFFDGLNAESVAITNLDDEMGEQIVKHSKSTLRTYSIHTPADYSGKVLEKQLNGMLMRINQHELWTQLIGDFNASNILLVYACATELLGNDERILTALSLLKSVDGRFQFLQSADNVLAIVDYAHTPDALANVLKTIKELNAEGNIITVVGCGGNRDATKRPEMARIAAEMSNKIILTSDNPRFEDPQVILSDMEKGLDVITKRKALTIADRKEAIKTACSLAREFDVILIAGKGHEKYQEINGVKHPFDDFKIIQELFNQTEA